MKKLLSISLACTMLLSFSVFATTQEPSTELLKLPTVILGSQFGDVGESMVARLTDKQEVIDQNTQLIIVGSDVDLSNLDAMVIERLREVYYYNGGTIMMAQPNANTGEQLKKIFPYTTFSLNGNDQASYSGAYLFSFPANECFLENPIAKNSNETNSIAKTKRSKTKRNFSEENEQATDNLMLWIGKYGNNNVSAPQKNMKNPQEEVVNSTSFPPQTITYIFNLYHDHDSDKFAQYTITYKITAVYSIFEDMDYYAIHEEILGDNSRLNLNNILTDCWLSNIDDKILRTTEARIYDPQPQTTEGQTTTSVANGWNFGGGFSLGYSYGGGKKGGDGNYIGGGGHGFNAGFNFTATYTHSESKTFSTPDVTILLHAKNQLGVDNASFEYQIADGSLISTTTADFHNMWHWRVPKPAQYSQLVLNTKDIITAGIVTKETYEHKIHINQPIYMNDIDTLSTRIQNGYNYVDLGLPSGAMWSTINLGASNSQNTGNYYSVLGGNEIDESNNVLINDTQKDIVELRIGQPWHTPKLSESEELIAECIWNWDEKRYGYEITGKNGNSIFLPAAGFIDSDMNKKQITKKGCYVCSTPTIMPKILYFNKDSIAITNSLFTGISIRPVFTKHYEAKLEQNKLFGANATLSETKALNWPSEITLTITPATNREWKVPPIVTINNASIKSNSQENGIYTYILHHFTDTATIDVKGMAAEHLIYNEHAYVDLGLPSGTLWATKNIGADSSFENGDYFAWGEISTKSDFLPTNSETLNQEISEISGDLTYDAASRNWGGSWRIPTSKEMQELIDNCTWQWVATNPIDGQKGYLIIGKNDNMLFLPAAGHAHEADRLYQNVQGNYTISTPIECNLTEANCLWFADTTAQINSNKREFGYSIRPVLNKTPFVKTKKVTNLSAVSARIEGEIVDQGLGEIIEKGFVYSEHESPTTSDNKIEIEGEKFVATIYNLQCGTNIFVRAYTINNYGTSYGTQIEIDRTPKTKQLALTQCGHYEWEGETFYESGSYTKTLIAENGCDSIVTLHLTIDTFELPNIVAHDTLGIATYSISEIPDCSYFWTVPNGALIVEGQYTHQIEVRWMSSLAEGSISVNVTNNNGCTATSSLALNESQTPSGIEQTQIDAIYAQDGRIYGTDGMQIFNIIGQDVTHKNGNLHGIYLVKNGNYVQKIVVRITKN